MARYRDHVYDYLGFPPPEDREVKEEVDPNGSNDLMMRVMMLRRMMGTPPNVGDKAPRPAKQGRPLSWESDCDCECEHVCTCGY